MGVKTLFPQIAVDLYRYYERILNASQNVLLLVIRLTWGFLFVQAGWGKWHNIPKVIGFFTDLGIPLPTLNAYVVATTELVGGLLLMFGLLGRIAPVPLIISMIVAYISSEQEALSALGAGNPDPFFAAAPFLFLYASLVVLVFGPGKISLDEVLKRRLRSWEK